MLIRVKMKESLYIIVKCFCIFAALICQCREVYNINNLNR